MNEIVNLNKVRKQKAKANKKLIAENNRVIFGMTKTEKEVHKKINKQKENVHTQHIIDKTNQDK